MILLVLCVGVLVAVIVFIDILNIFLVFTLSSLRSFVDLSSSYLINFMLLARKRLVLRFFMLLFVMLLRFLFRRCFLGCGVLGWLGLVLDSKLRGRVVYSVTNLGR